MSKLTHFNSSGDAHMVDVGDKSTTQRVAVAEGRITMQPETLALILKGESKKGDVLGVARIAGIMAAKRTSDLVPLCHPLPLSSVEIAVDPVAAGIHIRATAATTARTGVEMEAMTAAAVDALTVYDMVKGVD